MHAVVTMSYLAGAAYPAGGGQVISDRLAAVIEQHGGKILLLAPVTRIVVEGGRVVGVEFDSHHLGRRTVRAPVVISDADLKETLLDLVGPAHLKPTTVQRVQGYEMAPALGVVYLGVRRDFRAAGVPNTNFGSIPPTIWNLSMRRPGLGGFIPNRTARLHRHPQRPQQPPAGTAGHRQYAASDRDPLSA